MSTLRDRASILISKALGSNISPEDIECVSGFWKYQDVYRWEVWVNVEGSSVRKHYGCWETLSEFVKLGSKNGVRIDGNEISAVEFS